MRPILLLAPLALWTSVAIAEGSIESCTKAPVPVRCVLDLAQKESQRITAPLARFPAAAKILNAAAKAVLQAPLAEQLAAKAASDSDLDPSIRLDLLIALHDYRTAFGQSDAGTRLQALALYLDLVERSVGSARLSLMLTACGALDLPEPLAVEWQPMIDHGCTPSFLDETPLPGETDQLMSLLLAPIVFYRDDENEAFEVSIDRAHATIRDMDEQMDGKSDAARGGWQQLKAGIYLLHGSSFADLGDLLRTRLSAAAAYAAILAAEEITDTTLAEDRAAVAALLARAEQPGTAEQILDETTKLVDSDETRQQIPPPTRVGFLTQLVELLAEELSGFTCPDPGDAGSQPPI